MFKNCKNSSFKNHFFPTNSCWKSFICYSPSIDIYFDRYILVPSCLILSHGCHRACVDIFKSFDQKFLEAQGVNSCESRELLRYNWETRFPEFPIHNMESSFDPWKMKFISALWANDIKRGIYRPVFIQYYGTNTSRIPWFWNHMRGSNSRNGTVPWRPVDNLNIFRNLKTV